MLGKIAAFGVPGAFGAGAEKGNASAPGARLRPQSRSGRGCRIDESVAQPARAGEPGPRGCNLWDSPRRVHSSPLIAPAGEPAARRSFVDSHRRCDAETLAPVLARVQQDVGERGSNLARRPQEAEMVATVEDRARARESAVHDARETRRNRLHPAPERLLGVRFDDHVGVIALERVLQHAELAPLAGLPQTPLELEHEPAGAKARQSTPQAERHVSRTCRQMRPSTVLDARARPRRPTGAGARPAASRSPPQIAEGELLRHDERYRSRRRMSRLINENRE